MLKDAILMFGSLAATVVFGATMLWDIHPPLPLPLPTVVPGAVAPPPPSPVDSKFTREFTVASCNEFAKDFLRLSDFASRANLCVRLAIVIKFDKDPGNLLPQSVKAEPKTCSTVLYTEPAEVPRQFLYYAFLTLNRICFPE